jgi:hypothetical protein
LALRDVYAPPGVPTMELEKTVETQNGPVVVRKLVLNDYAELFRKLKALPEKFGKFIEGNDYEELKKSETIYQAIPELVAEAIPDFCELLSVVSDKDAEFFGKLDLADIVDLVLATLEVNDYQRIVASVKKMMALQTKNKDQSLAEPKPQPQP